MLQRPSPEEMQLMVEAIDLLDPSRVHFLAGEEQLKTALSKQQKVVILAYNQAKTHTIQTHEHAQLVGMIAKFAVALVESDKHFEEVVRRAEEAENYDGIWPGLVEHGEEA